MAGPHPSGGVPSYTGRRHPERRLGYLEEKVLHLFQSERVVQGLKWTNAGNLPALTICGQTARQH